MRKQSATTQNVMWLCTGSRTVCTSYNSGNYVVSHTLVDVNAQVKKHVRSIMKGHNCYKE